MRRFTLFVSLWLALCGLTDAAETSRRHVIGFSQDGSVFAFEEFGIGDGAGIPYAGVYFIDVATDRWIAGTPFQSALGEADAIEVPDGMSLAVEEQRRLDKLRRDMRRKAGPVFKKFGPFLSARQRARNTPFEFTGQSETVRFSSNDYQRTYALPQSSKVWRLDLSMLPFPADKRCLGLYESQNGFRLSLVNEHSGKTIVLTQDKRIPSSRQCPQSYHIEEVLTHDTGNASFSLAVLLRYSRIGFEGPDGRLLAATARVTSD